MSKVVAESIDNAFNTEHCSFADVVSESFGRGGQNGDKNLVDAICDLAYHARLIADVIKPLDAHRSSDNAGVSVDSLTEAVMGVTGGLIEIASAIQQLASAVESHSST